MMECKELLIFVAGLHIVEWLSDTHWKFVVRVRIIAPAGMSHSSSLPRAGAHVVREDFNIPVRTSSCDFELASD